MKKNLFLIFTSLLFLSCEKLLIANRFIIEGVVLDEITNKAIEDVKVGMQYVKISTFGGHRESIGSSIINSDGTFKLVFKSQKDAASYEAYITHEKYYSLSGFHIYPENLIKGKPLFLELKFTPISNLKINFKNLSPINDADKLEYYVVSQKAGNLIFSTNYTHSEFDFTADGNRYIGKNATGIDGFKVAGNKYAKIYITIVKNNITKKLTDSIYCKANEYQTYNLTY